MTKNVWYKSKNKKTEIYVKMWIPDGEPRAVVQIVHGMIEHIRRYDEFAEFLVSKGFLVVGHDHLGHGWSVNSTEEWGYFSDDPSRTLVRDIHQLRVNMKKRYPDLPYFILGFSMGSYLIRRYLADYGSGISGVIIMGTGHVSPALARFGVDFTKLYALFKGWNHRSLLVKAMMYNRSYSQYDMTNRNPEKSWLSTDPQVLINALEDPACRFNFTLNGYLGLFETVAFACSMKNVERIPKNLPVLIVSGEKDPVGGLGKGVIRFSRMCNKAGLTDKKLKLYGGDRHEILHERDKEVVFEDILNWMEAHL